MRFSTGYLQRFLAFAIAFMLAACVFIPPDLSSDWTPKRQEAFVAVAVAGNLTCELGRDALLRGNAQRGGGASQGRLFFHSAPNGASVCAVPHFGPALPVKGDSSLKKQLTPISLCVRLDE
jgi:hypothetical protein